MDDQNTQITIGSGSPGGEHIPEHMRPVSTVPMKTTHHALRYTYLALFVVVIAAGLFWWHGRGGDAAALQAKPAVVEIRAHGFYPSTIRIAKGQSVEWVNEDQQPHQIATDPWPLENGLAGFYDQTVQTNGDIYSFNFNKTGTFTYHDHLDPMGLKGTVIVQ